MVCSPRSAVARWPEAFSKQEVAMKSTYSVSALVVAVALALTAVATTTSAAGPAPTVLGNEPLAPGKFVWDSKTAPAGPLLVAINLDEQMAYVYRNGKRIGRSTVSSGKK